MVDFIIVEWRKYKIVPTFYKKYFQDQKLGSLCDIQLEKSEFSMKNP